MNPDYPLVTNDHEVYRLQYQAQFWRHDVAVALDRIGVPLGGRCLDLCCGVGGITDCLSERVGSEGEVVGVDIDPDKLQIAQHWAAVNGLDNVRFVTGDAFDTPLPPAAFDLVHARFAVGIIKDGLKILDHLLTLVRPGGTVFVEEADTASMCCDPPHPAWDILNNANHETFKRSGGQLSLGRELYRHFIERRLEAVQFRPCLHPVRYGQPMAMHVANTLLAVRERAVAEGIITDQILDQNVERLRQHLMQPTTSVFSFTLVQAWGTKP